MNNWGIGAIVGVIIGAVLGVVFTTKLLAIQNKWLTDLESKQAKLVQSADQLAKARTAVNQAEAELVSLTHEWGEIFPGANSGPVGPGVVQIGVVGPGAKEQAQGKALPFVYPFLVGQDGSTFLGEFKIEQVQQDSIVARLTRDLMPNEMQKWAQGLYRTRNNLPASWKAILTSLNSDYIITQDLLRAQRLQLQTLTGQIQDSQQVLDRRMSELSGNAAPPEGASQQVIDGLVQTLRSLDEERNQSLGEVDRLRKQLDKAYVDLEQTLEANKQKAEQLKSSSASAPQPRTARAGL